MFQPRCDLLERLFITIWEKEGLKVFFDRARNFMKNNIF